MDTESDRKLFWKKFYDDSIAALVQKYGIRGAYLFVLDFQDNTLKPAYMLGDDLAVERIDDADPVVACLNMESGFVTSSILYADSRYRDKRDAYLGMFDDNNIEIAIPFFGMDKRLIGVLFLGRLPGARLYTKTFISVLELFRIQFQHQLFNGRILDEVKQNQVVAHDRLVVDTIKGKIIPDGMKQVKGIRISSFHMNNSSQGGDYCDSQVIGKGKVALIMADLSYGGVDSGILALELYGAFHSPARGVDTPDRMLTNMNWVVSTSRFSKKYAPALCVTFAAGRIEYAGAAFNPLLMYNPRDNSFTQLETRGIPIGVDREYIYEAKEITAQQGVVGLMYSDGLASAMNASGASYGLDGVKRVVAAGRDMGPPELVRDIFADLSAFIGDHRQLSDISLILFKVTT
jgi:sigma-B regulation protein RsbU (phosphoserine phosphatase)